MKNFITIGLISGTSMDGIDTTLVETNGVTLNRTNYNFTYNYSSNTQKKLNKAITDPENTDIKELSFQITKDHIKAVDLIIKNANLKPNLIGFHGQTILHKPQIKKSIQLGDGELLANNTGITVISDFRRNDIKNDGEGAPLAPIYHQAIMKEINSELPCCIINIGGVSNLSYFDGKNLLGFDTGPGNGLIDWYLNQKISAPFDDKGILASKGKAKYNIINKVLEDSFFKLLPPKSLDRLYFKKLLETLNLFNLPIEDAVCTITEITIISILNSLKFCPNHIKRIIIMGGGQHNDYMINELQKRSFVEIQKGNTIGLPGDFIEAELMAFLAARNMNNLPITFPMTTGVIKPLNGGIRHYPQKN